MVLYLVQVMTNKLNWIAWALVYFHPISYFYDYFINFKWKNQCVMNVFLNKLPNHRQLLWRNCSDSRDYKNSFRPNNWQMCNPFPSQKKTLRHSSKRSTLFFFCCLIVFILLIYLNFFLNSNLVHPCPI